LTAPQIEAASKLYAGPKLFPGLEPGSELEWKTLSGKKPMSLATDVYKYLVFNDPTWDFRTIKPETDFSLAENALGMSMDSTNPNLKPFVDHGGKLIMYHGWSDPGIPPLNTVQYYKKVADTLGGADKTSNSIRLFMVPGMNHCRGGAGTDKFDGIAALSGWVENGKAPDHIDASHSNAEKKVDRTRPLCPYPQVAKYKGSGSTDDAANFSCK
jgi:feruloyl esterase